MPAKLHHDSVEWVEAESRLKTVAGYLSERVDQSEFSWSGDTRDLYSGLTARQVSALQSLSSLVAACAVAAKDMFLMLAVAHS